MADSKVTVVRGDYQLSPPQAHQELAGSWPVYVDSRETDGPAMLADHLGPRETPGPVTQWHLCCWHCDQSVLCLAPDAAAGSYQVSTAAMSAGVLSHIRQCHEDALIS